MKREQARFSKFGLTNVKDAGGKIDILAIQSKTRTDPADKGEISHQHVQFFGELRDGGIQT